MPKQHSPKPRQPSYRLRAAGGRAIVTLSGKNIYLGKHGSWASRRECDRVIAEWPSAGWRLPSRDAPVSVNEVLTAYLRFAKGYDRKGGRATASCLTSRWSCGTWKSRSISGLRKRPVNHLVRD